MKKLFSILLICLLVLGIGACSSNEPNNSLATENIQEEIKQEEPAKEIELEEVDEETQEDVKEETKQEKAKEETKTEIDPEILKTYNYWVVFYDYEGKELQREAIKWGTIPTYWSEIPYYEDGTHWYKFVGWKDKWGKDVKEFKPITGNTRFYAQYDIGGTISHHYSESNREVESTPIPTPTPVPEPIPVPPPDPDYIQVECLTSTGGANGSYIDTKLTSNSDMKFVFEAKMNKIVGCRPFGCYQSFYGGLILSYVAFDTYATGYNVYSGGNSGQLETNEGFGNKSSFEYRFYPGECYLKVNGSATKYTTYNSSVPSSNILIFTINGFQGAADNQAISIYKMEIYKSGILERDFIAVRTLKEIDMSKNATDPTSNIPIDTLCFYDQANDLYYLNSGTGSFTDVPIS